MELNSLPFTDALQRAVNVWQMGDGKIAGQRGGHFSPEIFTSETISFCPSK
jgi:hypothetical protein